MQFHYVAAQPNGKVVEGNLEAQHPSEVLEQLAMGGLRPISIKAIRSFDTERRKGLFGSTITVVDKVFLTKYLALMLRVGTDLFQAINILIADFDKPAVKSFLIEVRTTLEKGKPFYVTFAKYPDFFSPVFVSLIKAGEASGNLENIFNDLSFALEKERELRSRIKAALVYPVILLVASMLVMFFLVAIALPKISAVFETAGIDPPFFSKVVFWIGDFLGGNLILILVLMVGGGIFSAVYFRKTSVGRILIARASHRIPVLKNVLKRIALQRFASTLSSLMKAGLPILESLEISADAVGDEEIKSALLRVSREGIAKGVTIGEAFKREEVFPRVVTNLIAIGERAGHVEDILKTLSDFYETEIDASIKTLVAFLEPMLLLFIGITIGTIALSVIVPVYQLIGKF